MEAKAENETWMQLGSHRVVFLPPDVFRVFWHGEATDEDVRHLFAFSDRMVANGRYFVLADLKGMTGATGNGRKRAAEDPRTLQIAGLAMLNADFKTRVLMTMMERALRIFSSGRAARMMFFDAEADALAWIASERRRLGLD